jgi:hypothetical protein
MACHHAIIPILIPRIGTLEEQHVRLLEEEDVYCHR